MSSLVFQDIFERPLAFWDDLRFKDIDINFTTERPNAAQYLKHFGKSVIPKIKMLANELHMNTCEMFETLMQLAPDNSMSEPKKYRSFITEIQDLILDNNLDHLHNAEVNESATQYRKGYEMVDRNLQAVPIVSTRGNNR